MKQIYGLLLSFAMMMQLAGCNGDQVAPSSMATPPLAAQSPHSIATPVPNTSSTPPPSASASEETNMNQITIAVGGEAFSATLADNPAARAFAAYLPMTVQMGDLNGQEKFYGLPNDLPADSTERPSTIRGGDIFCWAGNTLVLFYATFQNSYGGYVRLGTVDNPEGLAAVLGSGTAEVAWSLAE